MQKDLDVRAQISLLRELKLKRAIDDMKEKILTLVDLRPAHEKSKSTERECKELKLDGHASFLHMTWNVFTSMLLFGVLTVAILGIVHFHATSISGLYPLVCLCVYTRRSSRRGLGSREGGGDCWVHHSSCVLCPQRPLLREKPECRRRGYSPR